MDSPNRSVVAGTYVAEQRASKNGASYVLQSIALPKSSTEAAPIQLKHYVKKRFEPKKTFVLPALSTIEPLLEAATSSPGDDPSDEDFYLPPIQEPLSRTAVVPTGCAGSRLWPSQRGATRLGDVTSPVPTDLEFKAWLQHPLVSPSPPPTIPPISAEEEHRSPKYHIMLLKKTFQDESMTAASVSATLMRIFGLSADKSNKIAKAARGNKLASIALCDRQSEAFDKVEVLRSLGIMVQIATEVGLPEGGIGRKRKGAEPTSNYNELIQTGLRNTDIEGHGRITHPLVLPPVGQKTARSTWKRRQVPISVLPEDPVEALFNAEIEAKRTEAQEKPRHKLFNTIEANKKKLNCLIALNQKTLIPEPPKDEGVEGAKDLELDQAVKKTRSGVVTKIKKENSLMFRYFCGILGNSTKDDQAACYDTMGTRDQVAKLARVWKLLDGDGSGRVDIGEFRTFAEDYLKSRLTPPPPIEGEPVKKLETLPEWMNMGCDPYKDTSRFVSRLVDKLAQSLLGKKSSFVLEDIYRVVWPLAARNEYNIMTKWIKEIERLTTRTRVKTPQLLDPAEFEGLCSVFRHFDQDGSGEVSLEELVVKGLIYADQMESYRKDWDRNGDGCFDMLEFCEMMCPLGYRAYPKSKIGSQKDGTRVLYDPNIGGWRLESEMLASQESEQAAMEKARDEKQFKELGGWIFKEINDVVGFTAATLPPPSGQTNGETALLNLGGYFLFDGKFDGALQPTTTKSLRTIGIEKYAWLPPDEAELPLGGFVFELSRGLKIAFPFDYEDGEIDLDEDQTAQASEIRKQLKPLAVSQFHASNVVPEKRERSEWFPVKYSAEIRQKIGLPDAARFYAWVYPEDISKKERAHPTVRGELKVDPS